MPDPMWEVEPTKGDAFTTATRKSSNGHRTGVPFQGWAKYDAAATLSKKART